MHPTLTICVYLAAVTLLSLYLSWVLAKTGGYE